MLFGEKPSDINFNYFLFFTIEIFYHFSSFGVKLRKYFFYLQKTTALEMEYGLNLAFRSQQSIGEYSGPLTTFVFELQA